MLDRGCELGKQIGRLTSKLAGLQDENKGKKRFGWFG
jgi:hypothetical protein